MNVYNEEIRTATTFDFVTMLKYAIEVGKIIGKEKAMKLLGNVFAENRVRWFIQNKDKLSSKLSYNQLSDLEKAYETLREFLKMVTPGWKDEYMTIISKDSSKIIIKFTIWCPFLEAAKILGIDTKDICPFISEQASTALFKEINKNLRMKITKMRPKHDYCEEIIMFEK